jgi:hypothetical protein
VHEVHLDRIDVAVHFVLAVHVEMDLEQPEGGAADGHGAARAGVGLDGVGVVEDGGAAGDVVEARVTQGLERDLPEVHW